MKTISNWVLFLTTLAALVYVNLYAWQGQQIKTRGEILFLELAPIDPLSLVQGQYMRLRFGVEQSYAATLEDQQVIQNSLGDALGIIELDSNRVGTLSGLLNKSDRSRRHQQRGDFLLLQLHAQLGESPRDSNTQQTYSIKIKQNSFLFQENTEDRYVQAKYGMFRVKENGCYILVNLADEHLRPLTPRP